ncbi:MAG: hypothetical protein M3015_09225, partial [Bacteroidota bacterium]|nr:hypothetical protein [Bacteroidota bacterium]
MHHKKLQNVIILVLISASSHAQNVAINNDQSQPNQNAILDIKSGTKGLLIPRMDSVARKTIINTKGLLVYDTSYNSFWFNTGSAWQNLSNGYGWSLNGNSGTIDGTQFIGTTDNVPLNLRVNGKQAGRIDNTLFNVYY